MKIHVLGGHGGLAKGSETTSFLIDDKLLIDAGAVAATLSIKEQTAIDYILISHCHLDHIKDLAFLCDNCFGLKGKPFEVYTHETVKKIIHEHLLNDIVWPDFSKLPNTNNPTITLNAIQDEKSFELGGYKITAVKVNHAYDAMGFIVEKDGAAVIFTGDTGPTERIWKLAHETKNLKAIFTEVSFPNELQKVADLSDHHTPVSINKEIAKMPKEATIILTHLKPNYQETILNEMKSIGQDRIKVLDRDGEIFHF